ncbi:MAG: hypothetical protein ACI4U3_03670 [Traorella sp.]
MNKSGKYVKNIQLVGSLINPPKIEATFKSVLQSNISLNTIRQYIEYLEDAFIISKEVQEKVSLRNIHDSFKKIIVVKDVVNITRDEEGITTMSIYDFLLKENSLEL